MVQRNQQIRMPFTSSGEMKRNISVPLAAAARANLVCDSTHGGGVRGSGNMVIQGENLEVLACLLPGLGGKVRCVYIDPPYNNREHYNHYEDNLDHEEWLAKIIERLTMLAKFLRQDGSLWISIDDREVHYLKAAADRVFGRTNFVATIVWEHRTTRENRKVFSNNHEYLLVYAKDARSFVRSRNMLPPTAAILKRYRNPDRDSRGPWQSVSAHVQSGHATQSQFYDIVAPNGRIHKLPPGRCWVYSKPRMVREIASNNVWFGEHGGNVPRLKRFLSKTKAGVTPETLWMATTVGTSDAAKKHILRLFPGEEVFDTPKPESLIARVIGIATNPGELVLDAYLGSGTTAAVAHKMGRKYIGIEKGKHAVTLCARRLRMVVEGEAGGISPLVNWRGGGGFDFFRYTVGALNAD